MRGRVNDTGPCHETSEPLTVFFNTYEDAPLWSAQLPTYKDVNDVPFAVVFRTGCYPNLAQQYNMSDNGVVQYQPAVRRCSLKPVFASTA